MTPTIISLQNQITALKSQVNALKSANTRISKLNKELTYDNQELRVTMDRITKVMSGDYDVRKIRADKSRLAR